MYKLSGHSLTKGTWFVPETQPMNLQERESTCSITLGPDAPAIDFDDWLLDDDWADGPYVWRVKGINDDTGADTKTVELEHVIKILDDLTLGEVTVEDIAGSGATTCSAQAAAAYILSKTSHWTLGDFDYGTSNPYEFNGETLYDALETVTDTLDNAVWEYDLSVYPFKVHIRQRDNTVRCEMRGERNLSTLKRSVSRSGMYTRIYPTGKNDLHIDGEYLSKNEGLYGRVDHRETDQSKSTKENLRAWAQGRLNRHCEPMVSITISGLELSQETGETLDNLKLNKVCQVPLPEYATTITERIVKKQWRDRRKEPENVTLTLANNVRDISSIVKEQTRGGSGGRAGAGQAKQNYLFVANGEHLLYEVFDECGHIHGLLRMTSESLRIAFENLNDSTRSEFMLTSESLRIQFENEIASTRSQFEMTSESLRIQFENEIASTRSEFEMTSESMRIHFENEISSTRSELEMTAESLRISFAAADSSLRSEFQLTASSLRVEFNNEASSLRSAINQEAGRIGLLVEGYGASAEVKRAAIILSINNGTSSAHIDADEVYIGTSKSTTVINGKCALSDVTADYIAGKIATIGTLQGIAASFSGNVSTTSGIIGYQVYADGNNISNPVMDLRITGPTSNVYTLQAKKATDTSWQDIGTFSRATTLSGAWGSGGDADKFIVTATPQGDTYPYAPPLRLNGTTAADNFSAEITDSSGGTTVAKKSVYGYLIPGGSGNGSYVDVNTASDGSGTSVARISVGSVYTDGSPASGSAGARSGSTYDWSFVITKGDGTTTTLTIDCTSIYSDARNGYTLGTFTLADITLQGSAVSCYVEVSQGGTNYYTAGTAETVYNAGSGTKYDRGDSVTAREVVSSGGTVYYLAGSATTYYNAGTVTKYDRGDTVTRYLRSSSATMLKDDGTKRLYDVNGNLVGNYHWFHVVTSGGTNYYTAGGTAVDYKGDGGSFTVQGSAVTVTPISSTSTRLGSAGTYYKGNGGSFTPQGTSKSVTPISGTAKMLAATTRYAAGTRYQDTYYTKS